MKFRLATWNINSVRLRMPIVERFIRSFQPDVLCLQEIKCVDELFPLRSAARARLPAYPGERAGGLSRRRHPVALSAEPKGTENFCGTGEARHIAVALDGRPLVIHNLYIPAGGDIPDPDDQSEIRQ